MVFSRFIWTILATVAAIAATAILLGIYLQKPGYPVTVSVLVALIVAESTFLIHHLVRIRRDLLRLIQALRNEDPTLMFPRDTRDPYLSAIHRGFNEIIGNFRLVRLDREVEHRFFEATVNHIQFGILAFGREGKVELVNRSFLELFNMEKIRHLDNLDKISADLPGWLAQLPHGSESLRKVHVGGTPHQLIFLASRFRLMEKEITLVSVRDISREIDRNEMEAWQKLMRVLRHEILNSLTPVRLLATSLSGTLGGELGEKEVGELRTGLQAIHRRAAGLSKFLDAYSNLYSVPELNLVETPVPALLNRILQLHKDQFASRKILCTVKCEDPALAIRMDERMIEQVLINLVKNAVEALREREHPELCLSGWRDSGESCLSVKDNGTGIPDDQLDHIFIPFYSTSEEGSGVGLSFSQHIMRLHHGRIHVRSIQGEGSEFQLVFRNQ